jgi:hypothetical protein
MRRRDFLQVLGGVAAAWPLSAHAQQQAERVRRIGVLMAFDENDVRAKNWLSRFTDELSKLGWTASPRRVGSTVWKALAIASNVPAILLVCSPLPGFCFLYISILASPRPITSFNLLRILASSSEDMGARARSETTCSKLVSIS